MFIRDELFFDANAQNKKNDLYKKMISLPAFLISLAIGLFVVYVWGADKREVIVYPSPDKVHDILFKDTAGQCFQMQAKEVGCPLNDDDIFKIPVQTKTI